MSFMKMLLDFIFKCKIKQAQQQAATETTACKQSEHFLSSKYNNFTASELLEL